MCTDLRERGLNLDNPMLFVLDGSKALAAAVKRLCGERSLIQRCQQHKTRNVLSYLPEKYHHDIRGRMAEAYKAENFEKGKAKLNAVAAWLTRITKGAASNLREGLEEILTVSRLGQPELLAKSLVPTNPIDSAFSVAGKVTSQMKRWRGDMRQRWATVGLLMAEAGFKRPKGNREIPLLQAALRRAYSGPS